MGEPDSKDAAEIAAAMIQVAASLAALQQGQLMMIELQKKLLDGRGLELQMLLRVHDEVLKANPARAKGIADAVHSTLPG